MTGMSSELGTTYNGWSLTEDRMSEAIEQIGQAIDITTVANQSLANTIQSSMGTTLKEYDQFSKVIDKLLRWRHKKHVEFETLSESLVTNQTNLGKLESSEHESQRLTAVLNSEGAVYTPPPGSQRPSGILATINSLIDNDPETTRRKNISKTKDRITTLEEQREKVRLELIQANEAIQKELNHFQTQKVADYRNALLAFAMAHRDYHHKALKAWKEARSSVDKIP
jgi:sorting nexin-4